MREKGGRRWRAWGTWVQLRGRMEDVGIKKRKQLENVVVLVDEKMN